MRNVFGEEASFYEWHLRVKERKDKNVMRLLAPHHTQTHTLVFFCGFTKFLGIGSTCASVVHRRQIPHARACNEPIHESDFTIFVVFIYFFS